LLEINKVLNGSVVGEYLELSNRGESMSFETDKLEETFTIRIPACTKKDINCLTSAEKKKLTNEMMLFIAWCLHEFESKRNFDPRSKLCSDFKI